MTFDVNSYFKLNDLGNDDKYLLDVWDIDPDLQFPISALWWSLVSSYKLTKAVYNTGPNTKFIQKDEPNPNKPNVFTISGMDGASHGHHLLNYINGHGEISDGWKKNIEWCKEKGIQTYFDYCWEQLTPWQLADDGSRDFLEFLQNNNVKILANIIPDMHKYFDKNSAIYELVSSARADPFLENFLDNNIVNTHTTHEFYTRYSMNHEQNLSYNLTRYTVLPKDKKYMFAGMIGECRKFRNTIFIGALHREDLLTDNMWSWLTPPDQYYDAVEHDQPANDVWFLKYLDPGTGHYRKKWHDDEELKEELIDYSLTHIKDIVFDNAFELQYEKFKLPFADDIDYGCGHDKAHGRPGMDVVSERRMPQEVMESQLYVAAESNQNAGFFTEKTFKPIALGIPTVVFGGAMCNRILKDMYGYEMFEEIIDYSFETDLDVQDDSFIATGNHTLKFVEELKRINKEGPKQFDQPIIKEKAAHNKNLFEKRSNTDSLLNEIKRWFEIK